MLLKSRDIYVISGEAYDKLLAAGWFRGSRYMNKADYICVDGDILSPVHIRLPLTGHEFSKSQRKVMRKVESQYRIEIDYPYICQQACDLYNKSKHKYQSFIYPDFDDAMSFVYRPKLSSFSVCVYDGDKLLAMSFFDMTKKSMASLICVYDLNYPELSLGYYTMLKEIEFAKKHKVKYYYPGYVMEDMKTFAYKFRIGECEMKNGSGRWLPQSQVRHITTKSKKYKAEFNKLVAWLEGNGLKGRKRTYPLHYAYHPEYSDIPYYRYPLFYDMEINGERHVATYDPEKGTYVWSLVKKSPNLKKVLNEFEMSVDFLTNPTYELQLLETVREVHLPIQLLDQLQISISNPMGQWSDPMTSFKMKASVK
ncbi:MAG: hypothetical protein R2809_05505 [Flavobacteriales bacterium]